LLAAEFADWHGPGLPEMLRRTVLGREPETWRGASIAVARLRDAGDGHLLGARPLSALDRLSPREHAVAAAYAAGRTHRQIAADAGISPATVRNQLQSVYAKLGVASKIELARSIGGTGSEPTGADPAREA
jgi:DNA-binding NarL/FixJ family response regulator